MDIHRCRFVPYQPHSINALAFSHPSDTTKKTPKDLRLALGRNNGDIEIWNPHSGKWLQETIFRGQKDKSIEGLVWTRETLAKDDAHQNPNRDGALRLFSIDNSSSVTEWDLPSGTPKRRANGNFGDLWCIAAQPRSVKADDESPSSQFIAAGCDDGNIVLFSTDDNDLRFGRSIAKAPSKKARILSISWKDEYTVVAGYDKSRIQVYDIRNKLSVRVMTLGKPADANETFVWCLKCLPNGTIVSGDSSGELKIWDAKNYSLVQRLKTHQSHILGLTASAAGDMIASVGVDRRTVLYQPVAQQGNKLQRWAQSMHRRFHQHDVKSIVAFESKTISVLVSGGVDTVPVVAPLKQWQRELHRSLPHLPQKQQMSVSAGSRLMITWWEREICIWHLPRRDYSAISDALSVDVEQKHELLTQLAIKGEENITSASISNDGQYILVATSATTKLFQLRTSHKNGVMTIHTRKIDLPATLSTSGARSVTFSPSGSWLCVVKLNNVACLAKIQRQVSSSDRPTIFEKVIKLYRKPRQSGQEQSVLGNYGQAISCVAFSTDGRILAVGDLSGAIDAWVLAGHEDFDASNTSAEAEAASNSSDDSSESDTDEDEDDVGDNTTIIHGQKWERNPSGSNLPRLGSSIIGLSFRVSPEPNTTDQPTETIGLHATRQTPHPIAQEMPSCDPRLVAITADHDIVEYDVLQCRLSNWSRRNPSSFLPNDFTIQKDRAMGILRDPKDHERLWVYGPTWLFMLDMSRDLQMLRRNGRLGNYKVLEPMTSSQKNRKRKLEETGWKTKRNTGAGDEIRQNELPAGLGKYGERFRSGENATRQVITVARLPSPGSDDDLEIPPNSSALVAMRREEGHQEDGLMQHDLAVNKSGQHQESNDPETTNATERKAWWITMEYRYVYGMATIGGGETGSHDQNMEVVIIERPMWEVELPPRYDGGQDWET